MFGGSGAGRPTPQVRPPTPPAGGREGRAYERRSDRHARRGHRRAQCAFKNSMTRWLCDSHYLSRFAALFIDAGAKRSVAEGCAASTLARRELSAAPRCWSSSGGGRRRRGYVRRSTLGCELPPLGNDPSAGSPTETLLRLLLPLNDRVRTASRPWVVVADLPGPVRSPH